MENKLEDTTETIDKLKKALIKLDLTLENFYDDDLSSFEKEFFIDCKLLQQSALNSTFEIEKFLKTLT